MDSERKGGRERNKCSQWTFCCSRNASVMPSSGGKEPLKEQSEWNRLATKFGVNSVCVWGSKTWRSQCAEMKAEFWGSFVLVQSWDPSWKHKVGTVVWLLNSLLVCFGRRSALLLVVTNITTAWIEEIEPLEGEKNYKESLSSSENISPVASLKKPIRRLPHHPTTVLKFFLWKTYFCTIEWRAAEVGAAVNIPCTPVKNAFECWKHESSFIAKILIFHNGKNWIWRKSWFESLLKRQCLSSALKAAWQSPGTPAHWPGSSGRCRCSCGSAGRTTWEKKTQKRQREKTRNLTNLQVMESIVKIYLKVNKNY